MIYQRLRNGKPLRFVFWAFCDPLPDLSADRNGEQMGRFEISAYVCNNGVWGRMGRNRVSRLEMGIRGGGRVSMLPRLSYYEIGKTNFTTD